MPTLTADRTELLRQRMERRFTARLRRVLQQQGEQAIATYEAGGSPELAAALITKDSLQELLEELYVVCGNQFALETYQELTSVKSMQTKASPTETVQNTWLGRLKQFISTEGANRLRSMVETTRKQVRKVLNQVVEDGLGVAEGARVLRREIASISQARAVTITRTEILSASNLGSYEGARATGLDLEKGWLVSLDGRERDSHRAANGQYVPLNGLFTVGGYPARYPGDSSLPAKEVVRCRCTIIYRPAS